jgi:hypothetical protein
MKEKDENRKGFRVPQDYFDTLDLKLMNRLKGKSNKGFKVPEGYFEDFEVKFSLEPESGAESEPKRVVNLNRPEAKKLIWMAVAASILLFFGVKYSITNQSVMGWEDLEQAELGYWIESDLAELNEYDIVEAYPDVELNAPMISNEELNAYLNEIELDQILYEN